MKHKKTIDLIKDEVSRENSISFAYIFGSVAKGTTGPLSDIDVAIFLSAKNKGKRHKIVENLADFKGPDHIDVVVLNDAPLLMQFNVIKDGILIKDSKERRNFEYLTMNRYLDNEYHERLSAKIGLARIAEKGLA